MKKVISGLLLLMVIVQANAQTFEKRFVTQLEERLTNLQAEWVSMNADTLLDFVIAGADADGHMKIVPYQNQNTATSFLKKTTQPTGMKAGHVQLADWNRDGKVDLLISAKTLMNTDAIFAFHNVGNFVFQKQGQKIIEHAGSFVVADFNNDAIPDILTLGDKLIRIYKNSLAAAATIEFELTGITAANVSAFDMNRDGGMDFVISGLDLQNKPVTSVYFYESSFKFTREDAPTAVEGALSLADVNDDGLFDIVVTGSDESRIILNRIDSLYDEKKFDGIPVASMFTGDLTSDGRSDLLLSAKKVNHIRELNDIKTDLDTTGLILQRMGDHDRDGDLDLVQVIDSIGSQWLKFYENTTPMVNRWPSNPGAGFAISTFNKTFIFWTSTSDDHTVSASITYDVLLTDGQTSIISPAFDLVHRRRTAVRHGNAGTNQSMVINGLTDARYYYLIQGVDNAYNGSADVCKGGVIPCFDLIHEDVQVCKGTDVTLLGDKNSTWYSMVHGHLGTKDELRFIATANDTIFAFSQQTLDCAKHRIFVVNVNDAPPSETQTIYACKGKPVKLGIAGGWSNISWDVNPRKLDVDTIDYVVNVADTVTVTASSQGCSFRKRFFVNISEPEVSIEGDGFQVLKGHSVQLIASGNVETWQWDPPQGLSDSTIPDPTATPSVTTEYIVTGTDSVGCKATATTHVLVQETAFVPNLFTPNGDGKNDNLMIYGLTATSRFNFKIFNREGSVVYETKDIAQASGTGWNGFVHGTRQPSGLYYWKVDGETPNGEKLLLNGKTTGSILLVH